MTVLGTTDPPDLAGSTGGAIPWNTPVTWDAHGGPAPAKWLAGQAVAATPAASGAGARGATPPTVSWTQPQTSSSPTHGGGAAGDAHRDVVLQAEGTGEESNSSFSGIAHFIKPYRDPVHFINWISVRFYETGCSTRNKFFGMHSFRDTNSKLALLLFL